MFVGGASGWFQSQPACKCKPARRRLRASGAALPGAEGSSVRVTGASWRRRAAPAAAQRAPVLPPSMCGYVVGKGGKLNPGGVCVVERPGLAEFFARIAPVAEASAPSSACACGCGGGGRAGGFPRFVSASAWRGLGNGRQESLPLWRAALGCEGTHEKQ